MKLELNEIFAVIDKVNSAELDSFTYRDADIRLSIKRKNGNVKTDAPQVSREGHEELKQADEQITDQKSGLEESAGITVSSPLVGIFYTAPAEDKAPFVAEGDRIKKGQVIGIVEAMKLMNEIESEYDGIVEEILVKNEQLVEYGQPLMRLREV